MHARALVISILVLGASASSALGATLGVSGGVLTYSAAAGTKSVVNFADGASGSILVTRRTAVGDSDPITLGAGCSNAAADGVGNPQYTCTGATSVVATTLDGDDTLTSSGYFDFTSGCGFICIAAGGSLSATPVTFNGGDGNDSLFIGPGGGNANGDAGNDTLSGANGIDTLSGGDGDDSIAGNDGNDVINGGDGVDTVFGGPGDDTIDAGAGNDITVHGDAGNDTVNGGAGNDVLDGGDNNDALSGGAGDDSLTGGAGDDTLHGDDGTDLLDGNDGADILDGGAGNDVLALAPDAAADTYSGGGGVDEARVSDTVDAASYTLDDQANDGTAGEGDNVHSDVEDINFFGSKNATLGGDSAVNFLQGDSGADTIDGGAGNDFLYGYGGNDTINSVDGYADRVDCGPGSDTATADQFDEVGDNCETVNRTTVGNANDVAEDAPPTVSFTAPTAGATMSTTSPNALAANVGDDHGITQVIFLAGTRVLCADTTAPYSCSYTPTDADLGKSTLTVEAIDSAQQTAFAQADVVVPRFNPAGLTMSSRQKRGAKKPITLTTKGKLVLPSTVSAARACSGQVQIVVKISKKTVATRRANVSRSCAYSSNVPLKGRAKTKAVKVSATFQGNAVLNSVRATSRSVKLRRR